MAINCFDGSLTPFVAKYCTTLGIDMDMARTMSGAELICAMSSKLNGYYEALRELAGCYNSLVSLYGDVEVLSAGGLETGSGFMMPRAFVVPETTGELPLGATAVTFDGSFSFMGTPLVVELDGTPTVSSGVVCETVDGVPTVTVPAQSGTGTFKIPPQIVPIEG